MWVLGLCGPDPAEVFHRDVLARHVTPDERDGRGREDAPTPAMDRRWLARVTYARTGRRAPEPDGGRLRPRRRGDGQALTRGPQPGDTAEDPAVIAAERARLVQLLAERAREQENP
ncbi:hypothetical protein ACIBKY_04820 [Nonomuraea sp. NPDC050394]|uniref:hypothetical protein n=1 Tax=Nonomuraea sp. NPDC050394 TaxID=3364363 RepID=UPI00379F92D8